MKLACVIALGLLSVSLVGCAASSVSKLVIGSGAFIHGGTHKKSGTDFASYYLESVDGAPVHTPSLRSSFANPVPIGPGERLIVVHYEGLDGTLTKVPRIAQAAVKAKIEPGVTYIVDGRNDGDTVRLWISRADTGEIVTEEVPVPKTDLEVSPLIRPLKYALPFAK